MHGAGSAAISVGSRAMRTTRTLLLPLIALPLAGCALLPIPGPGRGDIAVPPTAPGPSAEADPVSDEDLMRAAVVDYQDHVAVAGEVAMGRADPGALSAHLDPALLAEETSLDERLHAAGLTFSAVPALGEVRGRILQHSDELAHVQLEVCLEGEHVALGDSGRTLGRLEQTVDLVAAPETGCVFIVGRSTEGAASPVCR